MIDFTKAAPKITTLGLNSYAEKSKSKMQVFASSDNTESVNLNNIPHYRIVSPISTSKEFLSRFFSEFEDVKSATFICEEIKRSQKINFPNSVIEELLNKRQLYHKKIAMMRKQMWREQNFDNFEDYIQALYSYIKENGTYMNCSETADLLSFLLAKSGIKTNKVFMYTTNKQGERVNKAEHVFCILGLDKKANISDALSWGKYSAICDPWANIALSSKEGIEYYRKFFDIDTKKYDLKFEICPYRYPGWQKTYSTALSINFSGTCHCKNVYRQRY